jgi:sulfonate transport system substrate-binding protein
MFRRWLSVGIVAAILTTILAACGGSSAGDKPKEIRLDYAYYNPSSLVLRKFGWLEEELKAEGIAVTWTLSAGSNKANELLRAEEIDFGSTAGSAALLAKANGSPIKTVYLYSKPEWAALVVAKDSPYNSIEELKGQKIAATKGTDPYFFLLQTLHQAGLSGEDVEVVQLQHADGKTALERGDVAAWAGLDPHMAQTELEQGSRLIYRNIDFNTYGFLNARIGFLDAHPSYTEKVLRNYERARQWILDNPEEAAQILAEEASLSLEVAKLELEQRTVLTESPVPGDKQAEVLRRIIPIFVAESQVKEGTDVEAALKDLIEPKYIQAVLDQ